MTRPIYAVGDIHGQRAMLDDVIDLIESDGGAEARVVFLGDYVDRGPDSRGVLERLSAGVAEGRNWICLMGNHDRMMRMFLSEPPRSDPALLVGWDWFHPNLGGRETMASYGVPVSDKTRVHHLHADALSAVPDHHRAFLENLQLYHEEDDMLFVHAGIQPGIPLEDQQEDDLIWIRGPFHRETAPHPWLVVHGHTPVDRATHYGNRVNLDSGAGYGEPLTAAVFENGACHVLTAQGRRLLRP